MTCGSPFNDINLLDWELILKIQIKENRIKNSLFDNLGFNNYLKYFSYPNKNVLVVLRTQIDL